MSKLAQQIVIILVILFAVALLMAFLGFSQKMTAEKQIAELNKQLEASGLREKNQIVENNNLKAQIEDVQKAKKEIEQTLTKFKDVNLQQVDEQIQKLTSERDDFQKRLSAAQEERERLSKKMESQGKELAALKDEKTKWQQGSESRPADVEKAPGQPETATTAEENEDYWAKVLKEKAALQVKVENLTATLNDMNVEMVELKKKNSDIQLALSGIKTEKESIEREIKHGKDLADTLSLELARAQNEKKFLNDRVKKLMDDGSSLRDQIQQLTSTKIALEKSLVKIQDEKKEIEKKLLETENVIQNRIDQIWSIKGSLDKDFQPQATHGGQVQLPPIVVSSVPGQESQPGPTPPQPVANASVDQTVGAPPGFNGNVVSLNKENNFVIVDIGENDGLRIGETLSVYRGTEYVAGLEVIQLRKDIAAADIKEKISDIQVGDIVR